jgi:hypothetical protein
MWKRFLLSPLCLSAGLAWGQKPTAAYREWAATPPMGWNSWDSYGTAVREQDVKANADYISERLAKLGWQYVVVDIQWYQPRAQGHAYDPDATLTLDGYGRLLPAPNRFPSGFKALADYVHAKGLRQQFEYARDWAPESPCSISAKAPGPSSWPGRSWVFPVSAGPGATSGAGRTWARSRGCASHSRPTRAPSTGSPCLDPPRTSTVAYAHRIGVQRGHTYQGSARERQRYRPSGPRRPPLPDSRDRP